MVLAAAGLTVVVSLVFVVRNVISIVERFTLIDQDTMHYQVTIDDPNVYARPWTMAFPLRRNNERGFRLLEEACHEGERSRSLPLATRSTPMKAGGR